MKDRRLIEAQVTLRELSETLPSLSFARAVNVRHFPELVAGKHDLPAIHELVQLKSRDVQISPIWKGDASMQVFEHPYLELPDLRPTAVIAGYRFSFALTVDDLLPLRDLRTQVGPNPAVQGTLTLNVPDYPKIPTHCMI
ncbi:MAG: acetoacetate decarboxylase family protein [Candidatus Competibacteraceae bacterium]